VGQRGVGTVGVTGDTVEEERVGHLPHSVDPSDSQTGEGEAIDPPKAHQAHPTIQPGMNQVLAGGKSVAHG